MTEVLQALFIKNGLFVAFLSVGVLMALSVWMSKRFTGAKIPGAAIAILLALALAATGGKKGVADHTVFSGMELLGGSMLRDFAIVATALGASLSLIRKAGWAGVISLIIGLLLAFCTGSILAYLMGYQDAKSMATIGAGACTFIVGPVTGSAIGAGSDVIALSIAIGVVKSIAVTIATPLLAPHIRLNNPVSAIVYGGLLGTTSGVAAGLAATDVNLVPYGALSATFYTGLGCLICPLLYSLIETFM